MMQDLSAVPELSAHVREEIDRWVARFPPGRQRSAVIGALHAVQHENGGFLTESLMEAVARYLGLPAIQVFEVASFYSMFETKPVGRHSISVCTNISCMALRRRADPCSSREAARHTSRREHAGRQVLPQERRGVPRRLHGCPDDDGGPQVSREPDARPASTKSWIPSSDLLVPISTT